MSSLCRISGRSKNGPWLAKQMNVERLFVVPVWETWRPDGVCVCVVRFGASAEVKGTAPDLGDDG